MRLGIRERRAMGLTFGNLLRIVRDMKADGQLAGKDDSLIAAEVLGRLVQDNAPAFRDPGIDWDALIAFIEKLLPLILMIIELIWS